LHAFKNYLSVWKSPGESPTVRNHLLSFFACRHSLSQELQTPIFCSNKETFNVKLGANKTMTAAQTELNKLEKKVELLSKAMHMLLFEEKEALSKKESQEIEKRLSSYLKGKKSEFMNLEDITNVGSKNTQKRTKRA
jgi:ElaB/YqjD/DUF883 family membrane-anchored ribosome-binding protein